MTTWIVYTRRGPADPEIERFVVEHGGYWNSGPPFGEGVIESGDGALYLHGDPGFAAELTGEELHALSNALGGAPAGAIALVIEGDEPVFLRAQQIARDLAAQWDGYVDRQ